MILLPDESKVDKTISIDNFLKRKNITPEKKDKLKLAVKSLTWRNKLSDKVLPLKHSIKGLPEIEFFEIKFNDKPDLSVLRIIDEVIPYYVFFYCYNGEFTEYWVAEKEVINDKVKVYRYHHNNEEIEKRINVRYMQMLSVDQLFYDMLGDIRYTSNETCFISNDLKDFCKFLTSLNKECEKKVLSADEIRAVAEITRFLLLKGKGNIKDFIDYVYSPECENHDIFCLNNFDPPMISYGETYLDDEEKYPFIRKILIYLAKTTFYNFDDKDDVFEFSERIKIDVKIERDCLYIQMILYSINIFYLKVNIPNLLDTIPKIEFPFKIV